MASLERGLRLIRALAALSQLGKRGKIAAYVINANGPSKGAASRSGHAICDQVVGFSTRPPSS